jgi:flagellar protein FlaG
MSISLINGHTPVMHKGAANGIDPPPIAQSEINTLTAANANAQPKENSGMGNVDDAVKLINKFVETSSHGIHFSLDDSSGKTVVKIVEVETNTVLRQIPSAEALSIAQSLDKLQGLLIREKA